MTKERNKFYFIFGDNMDFPYKNTYLIVIADCKGEAMTKFQKKYPNKHKECLNYEAVYNEKQWEGSVIQMYYPGEPVEIIE